MKMNNEKAYNKHVQIRRKELIEYNRCAINRRQWIKAWLIFLGLGIFFWCALYIGFITAHILMGLMVLHYVKDMIELMEKEKTKEYIS